MERAELNALVRATGCATERHGCVFLCDPRWGAAERAQAEAIWEHADAENLNRRSSAASQKAPTVRGGEGRSAREERSEDQGAGTAGAKEHERKIAAGQRLDVADRRSEPSEIALGWLCIPTGGTSGGVKFARHDEGTLTAAARGFCRHFGLEKVNAVDVLPPHHVSGLMARVRCAETGGRHVAWDWKRLEAGERPALDEGAWVISLVPTQLQRLLASPEACEWLRGFALVALGGGPVWPALADEAAAARLPIALSYGMTETAAMITALRPAEFLAGQRSNGAALPHARVTVTVEGVICVEGESVYRGYFPTERMDRIFATQDEGCLDEHGRLHVCGRRDAVIITGGEKVNPAEVEAVLRESGELADVAVLSMPHAQWGAAVVACYPASERAPDWRQVEAAIARLAPYKRPKRFVAVAEWPRNAQGKLNRARLAAAVERSDDLGRSSSSV